MDNNYQVEAKNGEIGVEHQSDKKTSMFKSCFSFNGRIRRLEYGLSCIIFLLYFCGVGLFLEIASLWGIMEGFGELILVIPAFWFLISQGTRRCHDLGHSGWWQLIPFYGLVMLFADGNFGKNEYGENPKGRN